MSEKAASIDEYLDGIDPAFRPELERIRALVTRLVPSVEEAISYRMPTLKYRIARWSFSPRPRST